MKIALKIESYVTGDANSPKSLGFMKVADGPILPWTIPVWSIKGRKPGPTLCITAGTHGCEYPGVLATIQLFQKINHEELSGTLIGVPVVNASGYLARAPYICPVDNLNIGTLFAESTHRTLSARIARTVVDEIGSVCDNLIDLHGGDLFESCVPHTAFWKTGNSEVDHQAETIARCYGQKYILERPIGENTLAEEMTERGKPSILAEIGGEGRADPKDIVAHVEGVLNVMRNLRMIQGSPRSFDKQQIMHGQISVNASVGGIFFPACKAGDFVHKDSTLGEMRTLAGEIEETFRSPEDSVVKLVLPSPVKNVGDLLFKLMKL